MKFLTEQFTQDRKRLARFEREAQLLASLNHPKIAAIYGLEESDGKQALVLELVEGETLAERVEKGAIPLAESLEIALQIAEALEAAHEKGIIHRDLKPANVKITPEGVVKVLDFGLAREVRLEPGGTQLTTEETTVGTPAYMSPEQVNRRELDRRTDIWSFGCVLFEMLSGRRAFQGESIGDLFAAICKEEIDLDPVSESPVPIRRLIERCLRKDPRTRLRDIGDARLELEEILQGRSEEAEATVSGPRKTGNAVAVGSGLAAGGCYRAHPGLGPAAGHGGHGTGTRPLFDPSFAGIICVLIERPITAARDFTRRTHRRVHGSRR